MSPIPAGNTQAAEFINGDQDDNNVSDTYYWKVAFDQSISRGITDGATNLFQVVTSTDTAGTNRNDVVTSTATIIDSTPTDSETIVSFTTPATGIDETAYIHLTPIAGASSIFGARGPNPTNPSTPTELNYQGVSGTIITATNNADYRYALRSRARWAASNPLVFQSVDTDDQSANFGDITFRATFNRPGIGSYH